MMKTYDECMEYISSFDRFTNGHFKVLMDRIGNPQDYLEFIHIGGTNGKGSTAVMVQSVLSSLSYKTGLFISPFVNDFRERIQIDGVYISEKDLIDITNIIKDTVKELYLTGVVLLSQFDIITAISFIYFKKKACNIVVLEVGLGGRLDATNIIKKSQVSALCSISIDHTNVLGDNILDITREKCGIIKGNSKLVLNPIQDEKVISYIKNVCAGKNTSLIIPNLAELKIIKIDTYGSVFIYKDTKYSIKLIGKHQIYNCITAIEILKQVGINNIAHLLGDITFSGRMEKLGENIYIDGAHNIDGIVKLCENINILFAGKTIITIFAMSTNKDYISCSKSLLDRSDLFLYINQNKHILESEKCKNFDDIENALSYALTLDIKKNVIIIAGSLYNINTVKKILNLDINRQ